jgi:hypothetical protein
MPVPDQQEDGQEEQQGLAAGAGGQQQQGYDAAAGSTSGYEAYAWDPNYYAQYGANYGWDPSANLNYVAGAQYASYGGEQTGGYVHSLGGEHGGGYVHSHGGEHGGGYEHVAAAPYGVDYTGGYGHEVAAPMQEPVLPPEMGRIGGKRGRNDMPAQILEVNQAELMKNRPKQDTSKLTGLAFGPSYQVHIHHPMLICTIFVEHFVFISLLLCLNSFASLVQNRVDRIDDTARLFALCSLVKYLNTIATPYDLAPCLKGHKHNHKQWFSPLEIGRDMPCCFLLSLQL